MNYPQPLSTAPFPPNETMLHSTIDYSRLLGKTYYDDRFVYMLVKLSETNGANVKKKALKWVSRSAYTVARGTALTDVPAGVGPATMDVATTPDASYLLIIVQGRATVNHGDDTTNTLDTTRTFCLIDDDADKGKVRGVKAPKAGEQPLGKYISGTAADDADIVIQVQLLDVVKDGSALVNVADSASVTNTTTETAFNKTATIDGAKLQVGDVLHVRARTFCVSTNSTDTLTIKLYLGTEVIAATAAVDVANSDVGFIDAMIAIRTLGSSGTISASGVQGLGVPGTVTAKPFRLDEATEDISTTFTISVKATWSVASASNDVILEDLFVIHHKAATPN